MKLFVSLLFVLCANAAFADGTVTASITGDRANFKAFFRHHRMSDEEAAFIKVYRSARSTVVQLNVSTH